jgi:hypothetical protein
MKLKPSPNKDNGLKEILGSEIQDDKFYIAIFKL